MSEVVVNFLTAGGTDVNGNPTNFTVQPRVFDWQISQDAQNYYTQEMNQLQADFNAIDSSAGTSSTANDSLIQNISQILTNLNNWSQLKYATTGTVNQTYQVNGTAVTILYVSGTGATLNPPQIQINGVLQTQSDLPAADQISGVSGTSPISADSYFAANPSMLNPVFTPTDSSTALTTTMNQNMAQSLETILSTIRSASSAGQPSWDPILEPASGGVTASMRAAVEALVSPTTASIYNINGAITGALSAANQAAIIGNAASGSTSLQQILMVDYVSQGNQLLYNQMSDLQSAININQTALSYLNSLQDLMNQKDPQQFVLQLQNLNNVQVATGSTQQAIYDSFEAASYNSALVAISNVTDTTLQSYIQSLSSTDSLASGTFTDLASMMGTIGTYSINQIITNLQYLIGQINAQGGNFAGGLSGDLTKILQDFQAPNQTIQQWIQDSQTGAQGQYQNDLSNAVVASQSFDDTERENLRGVMFTFEEFYKSSSGLLNDLTQLLEKIADAIAR
ncbi:MAG: hypothetical protein JSR46_08380 [Verrucomicrobia bacterium]|nr:hypothetical protein [Verrucomicrobiota bacterium]